MNDEIWTRYNELWSGDDFDAREKFAVNKNLPRDLILDLLESEGDLEILCALGSNSHLPPDIAEKMFNYEYSLSEDEDPDLLIHRGLAQNSALPAELLTRLAGSEDQEIAEIAQETLDSLGN